MKSIKHLVTALTNAEGGKSQIKVGDMREAIGKLSDMIVENPKAISLLIENGLKRAKRKKTTV